MVLLDVLPTLLSPVALGYMLLGVVTGTVIGAIPGLTGTMLIALTVPLTLQMGSTMAMVLLVAMYVGAISGGLISATLMNIPGTPSSIMTTFDGYPMARSGKPGRAVGWGITSSFIGGVISWFFLAGLAYPISQVALRFSYFEYFSMIVMALVLIGTVSQDSLLKGLISGILGILFSTVGLDPVTASSRLTFGIDGLIGGLGLLPVLIGVFAVSQLLFDTLSDETPHDRLESSVKDMWMSWRDLKRQASNLTRSSLLGTWIGVIPGIGANVGSIVSYTVAKNASKTPERFGKGSEEGIVSCEAANNATICGALVPLITMGIPGSIIDAVLLGALILHNIQPGPLLFMNNPDIVYAIITTAFIANIMMFFFMLYSTPIVARLIQVPRRFLVPVIFVFCVLGTFAVGNRLFDVWVMLVFGAVGFLMSLLRVPLAPLVIGVVLGPIAEQTLRSGLMASGGSWLPFITRPVSAAFLAVALVMVLWPNIRRARSRMLARNKER